MSSAPASIPNPSRLRTYAAFVRFEHTLFSLPLILAGVFSVAGPALSATRWLLITIAAFGARTSAMALNRLIDRRLDALNPRTQSRELPSGRMKSAEAWTLLVVSVLAYVAACAALGPFYIKVCAVPLVVFAAYPYLKRFTPFCHFGVGLGLALAPLAGYAAAHPDLARPWPAAWLAGFALLWVSGFDIIYATLDEAFDKAHGVHSMVAWLGREQALKLSALLHRMATLCLFGVGFTVLGPAAGGALWVRVATAALVAGAAALLHLEQKWAEEVNLAFFKVNVWVGAAVLAIVLVARLSGGY